MDGRMKVIGKDKAPDFFYYGLDCISTARDLYQDSPERFYAFGILYIHGIELILKSFLLFRNGECNSTHDYVNLYKLCTKYNIFPGDQEAWDCLKNLSEKFYSDTIMARYGLPQQLKNRVEFAENTFAILNEKLIKPMQIIFSSKCKNCTHLKSRHYRPDETKDWRKYVGRCSVSNCACEEYVEAQS